MSILTPADHEERCAQLCLCFENHFGADALTSFSDFRPHFDGHWMNFCLRTFPLESRVETELLVWDAAVAIVRWLAEHRAQLHGEDVLQVIVGWGSSVLPSDAQMDQGDGQIFKGRWKAHELPLDSHDAGFLGRLREEHPE